MTSLAVWLLTGCGVALILIGGFFLVLRPPLMPEDVRFMGVTTEAILGAFPGLSTWLRACSGCWAATSPRRYCEIAGEPTSCTGR